MELTPEQQARAKVLFEYEEARKALAQRRDDIHLWGKTLIAMGEALLDFETGNSKLETGSNMLLLATRHCSW